MMRGWWSEDRMCWVCLWGRVSYSVVCCWWRCGDCGVTWVDEDLGEPA